MKFCYICKRYFKQKKMLLMFNILYNIHVMANSGYENCDEEKGTTSFLNDPILKSGMFFPPGSTESLTSNLNGPLQEPPKKCIPYSSQLGGANQQQIPGIASFAYAGNGQMIGQQYPGMNPFMIPGFNQQVYPSLSSLGQFGGSNGVQPLNLQSLQLPGTVNPNLQCDNLLEKEMFKQCIENSLKRLRSILENCRRKLGDVKECEIDEKCLNSLKKPPPPKQKLDEQTIDEIVARVSSKDLFSKFIKNLNLIIQDEREKNMGNYDKSFSKGKYKLKGLDFNNHEKCDCDKIERLRNRQKSNKDDKNDEYEELVEQCKSICPTIDPCQNLDDCKK